MVVGVEFGWLGQSTVLDVPPFLLLEMAVVGPEVCLLVDMVAVVDYYLLVGLAALGQDHCLPVGVVAGACHDLLIEPLALELDYPLLVETVVGMNHHSLVVALNMDRDSISETVAALVGLLAERSPELRALLHPETGQSSQARGQKAGKALDEVEVTFHGLVRRRRHGDEKN